ncbi:AAA family ATPase [Phenylobacterium sp. LjRoot225]
MAEADISFGPLNILVGPNGHGKSNIIDALYFLHDCVAEDLDTALVKRHGVESIRQWSRTRPYNIVLDVSIQRNDGVGRYRVILASARGSYRVVEEHAEWYGIDRYSAPVDGEHIKRKVAFDRNDEGEVRFRIEPPTDHLRDERGRTVPSTDLFLNVIDASYFSLSTMMLRPIAEELKGFLSYSIYPNTLREPRVVSRQQYLRPDGSNLASILKQINSGQKKSKDALITALQAVMPTLVDITVRSAGGYYVPVINVREREGEPHQFNMSQISDGTLRMLGLLTAFYQPHSPSIIALEEPEQMVHPGLLSLLTEAALEFSDASATRPRQAFITSHSPTLLDLVPPDSIFWTKMTDGITKCGPISARQMGLIKDHLFTPGELLLAEGLSGE